MSLLEALRQSGAWANRTIPHLNCGGCAVYAAAVATLLDARGVLALGLVETDWFDGVKDLGAARRKNGRPPRTVRDWNASGVHFSHVQVAAWIDGQWWSHDSNRTIPFVRSNAYLAGWLSVQELQNIARCRVGWNRSFNRKLYLRSVKMVTRKYLSPDNRPGIVSPS